MASSSNQKRIIRIGVIGLGEIAQVNHIPMLVNLSSYFLITYLCDVSRELIAHVSRRVPSAKTTTDAREVCSSNDVDAVLICSATAFHPEQCILALQHDKWVLVEKPIALTHRDIDAVIQAEESSKGKVFVGYQRRYAEAFLDAIEEVRELKIDYVRVRDIIGPNSHLVAQSGTFPKKASDTEKADVDELLEKDKDMTTYALETELGLKDISAEDYKIWSLLGGLGSHDISAMREIIGMPKRVLGASAHLPIWTVLFEYEDFPVVYESGLNDLHLFDAAIEVFTQDKIVRVQYDTPYIKGLPVTMIVKEKVKGQKSNGFQERIVRKTYEDPYTLEFLEFYKNIMGNEQPKTGAVDAKKDLEVFGMIMQAARK